MLLLALVQCQQVVVKGRGREQLVALDAESEAAAVGLLPPAKVAHCTRLLRTNIREEQLVGCRLVYAHVLRELAVGVVLHRSASVPLTLVHVVRQIHHHAEAQHIRYLGTRSSLELLRYVECAVLLSLIGQCEGRLYCRHIVYGSNGLALLVGRDRAQVKLWCAPSLKLLLRLCAHIVVGHGTPEVRLKRASLAKERLAANHILGQEAALTVELHLKVLGSKCYLRLLLLVGKLHSLGLGRIYGKVGACKLAYRQLLMSHDVARLKQSLVLLQTELDVEHHVLLVLVLVELVWQHHSHALLCRKHRDVGDGSVLIFYAVCYDSPRQ